MELEQHGASARGLRHYVQLVREAMGLSGDSSCVQLEPPVNAYLALEGRLSSFPALDVALTWDEENGWALAVEARCCDDLLVLSYLDSGVLPPPRTVARFAAGMLEGTLNRHPEPPRFRSAGSADDLPRRLAAYA
ncbi:hypothetical protein DI005_06035 [Prauserella sp. PE36]|uniref:DUF6292 domain-containing protein n=1 Tax=Prauserella endophytica TaxID=1592324 RepID=A0ABY2S849_9PSEU|nr:MULTISPECIES: DUF6292 family protein [Prauserella]PXY30238.1 hypothetical protein BAY59_13590 [Prauserella coralliicola]RBM22695.1 hypothetical protein DI005_06035 [Prauserella sp. PE36]TKG72049.1 hypothetical protein FCN18_07170 [Prauserella endophytica]